MRARRPQARESSLCRCCCVVVVVVLLLLLRVAVVVRCCRRRRKVAKLAACESRPSEFSAANLAAALAALAMAQLSDARFRVTRAAESKLAAAATRRRERSPARARKPVVGARSAPLIGSRAGGRCNRKCAAIGGRKWTRAHADRRSISGGGGGGGALELCARSRFTYAPALARYQSKLEQQTRSAFLGLLLLLLLCNFPCP